MQEIKIKYVGKGDAVVAEHNGKKYTFSRSNPVQIIPLVVYNMLQDISNPFRWDIVPFQDNAPERNEEVKKTIEEEVDSIEKDLNLSKGAPDESKKRGRPRKSA
jgi:hypothetical protein